MLSAGKVRYIFFIIASSLLLSGCENHQKPPIEKIYDVLENVAVKEKGFADQQDPLISLERKEKMIYNQMVDLGMKQGSQMKKLSDEALSLAEDRKIHMQKETVSLRESKKEFVKIAGLKSGLKDSAQKKIANELYQVMLQRYHSHEILSQEYLTEIKYDKQLYNMFFKKIDRMLSLRQ